MKYIYKRWWFRLAVWGTVFLVFFMMMSLFNEIKFAIYISLYATLTMLSVQLISSYKLIPLHKKAKPNAVLLSLLSLLIITLLFGTIEYLGIKHIIHKADDSTPPPIIFFYIRQLVMYSFIFFINYAIYLLEQTTELKISQKQLHEEKLETELKLLKAQIDPHFIFNALNNIYSLTYMQSEKAPESVLKLSEMLRYVFYDCSKDKVALNGEIKYIENYTAFQQMKSDFEQNITINVRLNNSLVEISPMLLIPFIENAFKYSRIEEYEEAYIAIQIKQNKDTLIVNIKYSVPKDNKPLAGSGMGISNVRHRLNIIYPQAYTLDMDEKDDEFEVRLDLKLQ